MSSHSNIGEIAHLKEHGRPHGDPKPRQIFSTNSMSQHGPKKTSNTVIMFSDGKLFPSMTDINVTEEGDIKLLLRLNTAKSCGSEFQKNEHI